jgi:hypothetical protein
MPALAPPYSDLDRKVEKLFEAFFAPLVADDDRSWFAGVNLRLGVDDRPVKAPSLIIAAHDGGRAFPGLAQFHRIRTLFGVVSYIKDSREIHAKRCADVWDVLTGYSPDTATVRRADLQDLVAELNTLAETESLGLHIVGIVVDVPPENRIVGDTWQWGGILSLIVEWSNPG